MTDIEALDKLEPVFAEVFGTTGIRLNDSYRTIPGWDSVSVIELMYYVQKEFGCAVDTADIAQYSSVRKIIDLVRGVK